MSKGLVLVATSVFGGIGLATIALMTHRAVRSPPMAHILDWIFVGVLGGAILGLLSSTYVTSLLIGTRLVDSLPRVFGASALSAAVIGSVNPGWAAPCTMIVQILMCCRERRFAIGPFRFAVFVCQSCRYDLRGITTNVCPECGGSNTWREYLMERATIPGRLATIDFSCPACGYNLRGIREARCPECGRDVTVRDLNQPRREFFLRRRAHEVWRVGIVMALVLAGVHLFLMLRALFDTTVRASAIPLPGVSLLAMVVCGAWAAVAFLLARRARNSDSEPMVWISAGAAWLGVIASLAIAKFG